MSERDGTLRASLNYNTDLFDASTIERMLGHFQILLEGIVANPDQPISELPLLTDAEKAPTVSRVERHQDRLPQRQMHSSAI